MSWGGAWGRGTRKEGREDWPTGKDKRGGRAVPYRKRKGPAWRTIRGVNEAPDYLPLPARAERISNKVKSKHRARYPRTRRSGFIKSSRERSE